MKSLLKAGLALGIIALAVLLLAFVWSANHSPPPAFPNPNGYRDLLNAGRMLSTERVEADDLTANELTSLVNSNADALRLARSGLQKQSQVPVDYSDNYLSNHLADLAVFKRLTRAFIAEGKLAEREGGPERQLRPILMPSN